MTSAPPSSGTPVSPRDPVAPPPGPAGRVLVVEDEQGLARALGRALGSAGFAVDLAFDGTVAADLARQGGYDVIFSDIGLPGMTGLALLRTVREHDLDVPVVLMTGDPGIDTAIEAVTHGALRYLLKPIDLAMFIDLARSATRLHRMALVKRQALALLGENAAQAGDLTGLEVRFERALATLWMAFQPIVRWSERRVIGYEALVRGAEPSIPHPGALFEAAERLGRLVELGRTIRRETAAIADHPELGDLQLFVNLNPHDLLDDLLFDPQAPLSRIAGRVILEITERSSLDRVSDVRGRIERLSGLGFRIAIDDLGAGYAGLTSFAQLQPNVVKLDMSLVRDLHRSDTKQRIVRSMLGLCQEMGMLVVAEGVETPEERDQLVALGCDLLQGYLFARPGRPFPPPTW